MGKDHRKAIFGLVLESNTSWYVIEMMVYPSTKLYRTANHLMTRMDEMNRVRWTYQFCINFILFCNRHSFTFPLFGANRPIDTKSGCFKFSQELYFLDGTGFS